MRDTRACHELREEYNDRINYDKGDCSVLDLQQQVTGVNISRIEEGMGALFE